MVVCVLATIFAVGPPGGGTDVVEKETPVSDSPEDLSQVTG